MEPSDIPHERLLDDHEEEKELEELGGDDDDRSDEVDDDEEEENDILKSIRVFLKKYSFYVYSGITICVCLYFFGMTLLGIFITFVFRKNQSTPEQPIPEPSPQNDEVECEYRILSVNNTGSMITGYLELIRNDSNYENFQTLSFEIYQYQSFIRFRIFPVEKTKNNVFRKIDRWEVPITLNVPPILNNYQIGKEYEVKIEETPFSIEVMDKSSNEVIFEFKDLHFSDQYLSIKTNILSTSEKLFGFSTRDFFLNPASIYEEDSSSTEKCYYLWNKDEYLRYNFHPFTLFINSTIKQDSVEVIRQRGLLILTSNLIESCIVFSTDEKNQKSDNHVEYRSIGGIWDIFAFLGEEPVFDFQRLLGPNKDKSLPPLWSLGFHQSRWGYNNISVLRSVVESFDKNEIPLDAIWSDIDYMDKFKDFTFDPQSFPVPKMKEFSEFLHGENFHKKYVVIIDPGIMTLDTYYPYILGKEKDIFIKRSQSEYYVPKYATGIVWPGYTVYPDFSNPSIKDEYWKPLLKSFLEDNEIQIDGIWIDMNEVSNFCNGVCDQDPLSSSSSLNYPPYLPRNMMDRNEQIYTKTIPMDSSQYLGSTYNLHNMYGYHESIVTQQSFEEITGKRSFVLTRSTFLGSGNYVSNWLGDNFATFDDLRASIRGIFAQNMFGIQHVGADICGFNGIADLELCVRWYEIGSLYPFARQHSNQYNSNFKEPFRFGDYATSKIKKLIENRYSLIPYLYSLFHRFRENQYGMIWSPLFLTFPSDPEISVHQRMGLQNSLLNQVMLGKCVMIAPVVNRGIDTIDVYFPKGITFYDFYSFRKIEFDGRKNYYKSISTPLGTLPLFYKEGCVVPRQEPGMSTELQKSKPYILHVSICISEDMFVNDVKSYGELYLDDGLSVIDSKNDTNQRLTHYQFVFDPLTLTLNGEMERNGFQDHQIYLHQVHLMGYRFGKPSEIWINHAIEHVDFTFVDEDEILVVNNLQIFLNSSFSLEF